MCFSSALRNGLNHRPKTNSAPRNRLGNQTTAVKINIQNMLKYDKLSQRSPDISLPLGSMHFLIL